MLIKNDLFLLYVTGHGKKKVSGGSSFSTIDMTDGNYLQPDTLEKYLNYINPSQGILLFTQCYSGGFSRELGRNNYIAIANSSKHKPSYGTYFGNNFFKSFNNKKADKNKDNKISIMEAYKYACEKDPYTLNQQIINIPFRKIKNSEMSFIFLNNQPRMNHEKSNPKKIYLSKLK